MILFMVYPALNGAFPKRYRTLVSGHNFVSMLSHPFDLLKPVCEFHSQSYRLIIVDEMPGILNNNNVLRTDQSRKFIGSFRRNPSIFLTPDDLTGIF